MRCLTRILTVAILLVSWIGAMSLLTTVKAADNRQGQVLQIDQVERTFASGLTIPEGGWKPDRTERLWPASSMPSNGEGRRIVWSRMTFDRTTPENVPLALFTENNRDRIMLFLNGAEIFRSFADESDPVIGWNKPYLVPLPLGQVKQRENVLVIRVDSGSIFNLSSGKMLIGPQRALQSHFAWQHFWRIDGPRAANYAMLFLTLFTFIMWAVRRQDSALLMLSFAGVLWFARNLHFFAERVPFDPIWFNQMSYYSIYFATAAMLSFCIAFLKLPGARRHITQIFAAGVVLCVLRLLILRSFSTDMIVNLLTLAVVLYVQILIIRDWLRTRASTHLPTLALLAVSNSLSIHDLGRIPNIGWWDGLGFHIQPFIGSVLFAAFLLIFGYRAIAAFRTVEGINSLLETKVKEARDDLEKSEAERRALEVEHALEVERERIMREMHDGIGSNLVTALAVAERQRQPATTLATLRRAISDLKITVDSFEPVEGDVVALIANLRQRMEPDLREAGLTCLWRVQPCEPLVWLDAGNALHVLRIFQEGIGNVLAHSGATLLEIECQPAERDGRSGIRATLADNGCGLEPNRLSAGRGIAGMHARAEAIGGIFTVQSNPGQGTHLDLWLPLVRSTGDRHHE